MAESSIDEDLLCSMLGAEPTLPGAVVNYTHEGVVIIQNGTEQTVGTLFILVNRSIHYIVWAPYTYLFCVAPQHVSSSARSTLTGEWDLPIGTRGLDQRPEWKCIICFPLYRLSRITRRGRRVKTVTLVRDGTVVEPTLRFQDGGCTKFWEVISGVVKLRGDPRSAEEFIVDMPDDVSFGGNANTDTASNTQGTSTSMFGQVFSKMKSALGGGNEKSPTPFSIPNSTVTTSSKGNSSQRTFSPPSVEMESTAAATVVRKHSFKAPTLRKPQRKLAPELDEIGWLSAMDGEGRVTNPKQVCETVYAGGMHPSLRKEVWPFLLGMYAWNSTFQEREKLRKEHHQRYLDLKAQWTSIREDQAARFQLYRDRFMCIQTDIIRTDRTLPEYEKDDSVALIALKHILNTYSFYNFDLGYCQGMTDIASPLYLILKDEADAFWAFVHCMDLGALERNFHSGSLNSMHNQLDIVNRLIQIFVPTLADYLDKIGGSNLSFMFRWLLVRFKREFSIEDVMKLWEVMWACPSTQDFHLIIAVTLMRELTPTILEVGASFEDLLRMTNDMSNRMKIEDVIVFGQDMYDLMIEQYNRKVAQTASSPGRKRSAASSVPSVAEILAAYEES
eukprot:PhF_6_TR24782/c0_g1_i1/m.34052/K20168/TBC1D15; TBC1 domain family member 15